MPSRYHPLYDGIWDDDAFDAFPPQLTRASFEEIAFFVFLFANHRQRPSGIYRATDAQLAMDTRLSVRTVRTYLVSLEARRRIVRDGAWLFVRGYLARQPKHANLLASAQQQVMECSSAPILLAFGEKYQHLRQWSANRLATVAQPLPNGLAPIERNPSSEQSSTEQSRAEQRTVAQPSGTLPADADSPEALLAWLNAKAGRTFRPVPANLNLIRARLQDGIQPWQLRAIVSRKTHEWNGNEKMHRYLRPETLFAKLKCEQYLGELPAQPQHP